MSELSQLFFSLVWSYLSMLFIGYLIAKKTSQKEVIDTHKKHISSLDDHVDTLHRWQETLDKSFEKDLKIMDLEQKLEKYLPITEKNKDKILNMLKSGLSHSQIAKEFWVHKSTITHAIHKWTKKAV